MSMALLHIFISFDSLALLDNLQNCMICKQSCIRGGFVEHESDLSSTTKCDQNHRNDCCKFFTAKAAAKHELLFNKLRRVC